MTRELKRSSWNDHDWQLIHTAPQTPLQHIALDQVLLDEVATGHRAPTLRIWEWAGPAVVIGIFQSLKNEVDAVAAEKYKIEVVRRISGGGATFIEPENSITYSIYAPLSLIAGMSFRESYAYMDEWVLEALGELDVKAWYQPLNDITSAEGKIGGAAQARHGSAVLHHVTMAYDIDAAKMLQILRIGREKISDKGIASAAKRVDPLRRQTGLPREAIINHMIDVFRRRHGLHADTLSPSELTAAERLIEEKFGTKEWRIKVP